MDPGVFILMIGMKMSLIVPNRPIISKARPAAALAGLFFSIWCLQARVALTSVIVSQQPEVEQGHHRITAYEIRASVLILGDQGSVGSMKIEQSIKRQGDVLERVLYMHGNTDRKQVEKGRDVGGEFLITKRLPLGPDGSIDQDAQVSGQDVENHYRGHLKKDGEVTGEEVAFFPDHVISTREDGKETKIYGKYGSPLAALEYLIANDIQTGDVFESKFILNGYPYIFKCEVKKPEWIESLGVSAFKVMVSTFDGKRYRYGKPVAIKKRGIRIWFCKEEGHYRNTVVQMNIKYKWYLTLKILMVA
jgi:hypothetical protein